MLLFQYSRELEVNALETYFDVPENKLLDCCKKFEFMVLDKFADNFGVVKLGVEYVDRIAETLLDSKVLEKSNELGDAVCDRPEEAVIMENGDRLELMLFREYSDKLDGRL